MPSSISNSEAQSHSIAAHSKPPRYLEAPIALLLSLSMFCGALEITTRAGFGKISRVESRVAADYKAALSITGNNTAGSVLLAGNSLLLEDVDVPQLRNSLPSGLKITRFAIEQTQYLDWYFGLKRLFAQGVRPKLVVLCMNASHLISGQIRGDYSSYYLFRLADIPEIRRDAGYNLTKASDLVFAHFSLFYAGRTPLRNFVLLRSDPAYGQLLHDLATVSAKLPPDGDMERIATSRLTDLRLLCAAHNANFVFLLPPGFGRGEEAIMNAGTHSEAAVFVPIHLNDLPQTMFRDGFHLNAEGARICTEKMTEFLREQADSGGLLTHY